MKVAGGENFSLFFLERKIKMKIRFGVWKKVDGKIIHKNDKIIIHNGDWEDEETHRHIRNRIFKKYPGWNISGYVKAR